MASVSSVARLYLGGFSGCRRSSHSRSSGRLCTRQPVARQTSSMPLFSHSKAISCSSWRMVSASSMSSNSARISRNGSGCAAQSRAVSSMRLACVEFIRARGQVWLSQFGAESGAKKQGCCFSCQLRLVYGLLARADPWHRWLPAYQRAGLLGIVSVAG